MEKIYGYARISRPTQKIERQVQNIIQAYPSARIFQEAYTGTKIVGREQFAKLLKTATDDINRGHSVTIVFDSVSRMSRNADDGIKIYFELFEQGVNLVFLKERYIDTETYKTNLRDKIELTGTDEDEIFKGLNNYFRKLAQRQIRIAFEQAQKEVDDLRVRTSEGIREARHSRKQIGQKPGAVLNVKKKEPMKAQILRLAKTFGGSNTDREVMMLTKLSRNTYYKYKKELLEQLK